MSDQSMLDNTTVPPVVPTNPHEIALQSLCKQLLKSRLFRGFYVERRYVENVKGYRDIVSLQKSEKSLDKMLKDIRDKLQLFYSHQNPQIWIGITSGPLAGITKPQPAALETHLWVEMKELAFGQYWFSIKSIRFRDNEIILKLKEVQPVEEEEVPKWAPSSSSNKAICDNTPAIENSAPNTTLSLENQITFDDFIILLQQWWATIKQTVYDFMAQDISKENIKGVLRFLGLLIVSILSGALVGVKFLGIFTLRFMFELSRLTHVLTPIIFKIIEVFNKIIGGFYILLAMIWKDTVVKRNQPQHNALEYNRPIYKSIEYDVRQRRQDASTNFDKSFQ
ncbi:uncharacterized protein LOC111676956 [Lucilia cuprina]|uniref:uncharacterized protein LOC111676956 n=1 Tax=Lucilia cuprina TaxID=7375 RepID=UPI001F05376A|nr:uncharacterized protein LOC111676956 [Lucilia cuprina]XP_046805275.1 uncharacterized protein LOC111676956 [Lucilia cuprina]XP_046805276.1 uncharacterized protein LOC111676956 [Lucilia cuprina]